LIAPPALAGASPEDAALADSLYAEGGKLMEAGRWAEACPKIEASLKLDPGIGSTLRLAYCWEKLGRTASAWSMYNETEGMARKVGDKRADEAAKHAKQLEPLLSRLVLDVAPENQAGGVEIRRDGKVIDPVAWTSGIPIDPGTHVLEASAPGRLPWKTTLNIEAKPGPTSVRVPALEAAPAMPNPTATPDAAPFWGTQRVLGVALGAVGLVGIGVGSAFTAKMAGKNGDSLPHCQPTDVTKCDAAGVDLRNQAFDAAHVATGTFVGGSVALAAGVVVFLTAPRAGAPKAPASARWIDARPVVGPGVGGITVQGTWRSDEDDHPVGGRRLRCGRHPRRCRLRGHLGAPARRALPTRRGRGRRRRRLLRPRRHRGLLLGSGGNQGRRHLQGRREDVQRRRLRVRPLRGRGHPQAGGLQHAGG
jgi:serine/threonine-protein kinase